MSSTYTEIVPSPALSTFVECFWISEIDGDTQRRILPDGCLDFLFFLTDRKLIDARVVGVMTRPRDVNLQGGQSILGVRFHPGMAKSVLPLSIPLLNDQTVSFREIFPQSSHDLLDQLRSRPSTKECISIIEQHLIGAPKISLTQTMIAELVGQLGHFTIRELASATAISPRQLRRIFIANSGLSPKELARILRFRNAVSRIRKSDTDLAEVAIDCGYFDQSHLTREFRCFAGVTPWRFRQQNSTHNDRFVQEKRFGSRDDRLR